MDNLASVRRVGLSPRAWGTGFLRNTVGIGGGFIPTCVGNSRGANAARRGGAVHPHVCGEQMTTLPEAKSSGGSSPRVWGTGSRIPGCSRRSRFIPTCVGNRKPDSRMLSALAVHPHVCGEQSAGVHVGVVDYGSSPRVWGTVRWRPPRQGRCHRRQRFIPTCVGNSRAWCRTQTTPTVHPHVCGEQTRKFS